MSGRRSDIDGDLLLVPGHANPADPVQVHLQYDASGWSGRWCDPIAALLVLGVENIAQAEVVSDPLCLGVGMGTGANRMSAGSIRVGGEDGVVSALAQRGVQDGR